MSGTKIFSHSQLETLTKCGQQWYYRYVEGLRIPPAVRMVVGRAVDHSVNENLREKMKTDTELPLESARDLARDGLQREWDREGVLLEEEEMAKGVKRAKGDAIDRSVALAGHHHQKLAPSIRPTAVQREFRIAIADYGITLKGYIDIEEGEQSVRDTKTSKKSPADIAAAESMQLTTYALAKKVLDGKIPKAVHLDYLIDRSSNKRASARTPKHKIVSAVKTEADFRPLLARVERALTVIESGLFMPAPIGAWWCSKDWCGYYNICPWVNKHSVSMPTINTGGE